MKRYWEEHELAERWSLKHDEFELVRNRTERSRLGFTVLLKFFQVEARFPVGRGDIPDRVLDYLAAQLDVPRCALDDYNLRGRTAKRDRGQIRQRLGFRQATVQDGATLVAWLRDEVIPVDRTPERLRAAPVTGAGPLALSRQRGHGSRESWGPHSAHSKRRSSRRHSTGFRRRAERRSITYSTPAAPKTGSVTLTARRWPSFALILDVRVSRAC